MVTIDDIRRIRDERDRTDRRLSIALAVLAPLSSIIIVIAILIGVFMFYAAGMTPPPQPIVSTWYSNDSVTHEIIYSNTYQIPRVTPVILGIIGTILVVGIAFIILEIYVMYRWLDARNKHFNRSREFFKAVSEYLGERIPEDVREDYNEFKGSVDAYWGFKRSEVGPVVWAILAGIFSLGTYMMFMLNIDYYTHRKFEEEVASKLSILLEKMGLKKATWKELYTEREVLLYALITILTLGIFTIYWFYAVTKDQNEHFENHYRYEDEIIEALEKL